MLSLGENQRYLAHARLTSLPSSPSPARNESSTKPAFPTLQPPSAPKSSYFPPHPPPPNPNSSLNLLSPTYHLPNFLLPAVAPASRYSARVTKDSFNVWEKC